MFLRQKLRDVLPHGAREPPPPANKAVVNEWASSRTDFYPKWAKETKVD